MNAQALKVYKEKLREEPVIPKDMDRPEESASDADGITVINDSGFDVTVLVANQVLGLSSAGYIRQGNQLVLPAGWAWWDVYVLYENLGAHLIFSGITGYYHKKKGMVGYRDTLKISQM